MSEKPLNELAESLVDFCNALESKNGTTVGRKSEVKPQWS